jgi:hypothetical protein
MSRLPLWFPLITIAANGVNAYGAIKTMAAGESWGATMLVCSLIGIGVFGFALRNRTHRPVLKIDDDSVTYGSIFAAFPRSAQLSDVAAIVASTPRKVVLRMKSGKDRKISLFEVSQAEREQARRAITDAIGPGRE